MIAISAWYSNPLGLTQSEFLRRLRMAARALNKGIVIGCLDPREDGYSALIAIDDEMPMETYIDENGEEVEEWSDDAWDSLVYLVEEEIPAEMMCTKGSSFEIVECDEVKADE